MNMPSPFLTLNCSCDEALLWSSRNLRQQGMRVVQTFDLHAARHPVADCPCPSHGTGECDCQMLILLVYGEALEPVTLMLHGNDGRTWLSIAEAPGQNPNRKIGAAVKNALEGKLSEIKE